MGPALGVTSQADETLARSLGADLIARRGTDYVADVLRQIPGGVDALADAALLGSPALDVVADNGAYSSLRAIGERATAPLPEPAPRGISYKYFGFYQNPDVQGSLQRLVDADEGGHLTRRVAQVINPGHVAGAHAALEAGGVRGRFVLSFGPA